MACIKDIQCKNYPKKKCIRVGGRGLCGWIKIEAGKITRINYFDFSIKFQHKNLIKKYQTKILNSI